MLTQHDNTQILSTICLIKNRSCVCVDWSRKYRKAIPRDQWWSLFAVLVVIKWTSLIRRNSNFASAPILLTQGSCSFGKILNFLSWTILRFYHLTLCNWLTEQYDLQTVRQTVGTLCSTLCFFMLKVLRDLSRRLLLHQSWCTRRCWWGLTVWSFITLSCTRVARQWSGAKIRGNHRDAST